MNQSHESRYLNCATLAFEGMSILDDRVPYRYQVLEDTIQHVASSGDDWTTIAQRYYSGISGRACGLWWVLCEFQPQPVVDPTLTIPPGTVIHVPSPQIVQTNVLGARVTEYL